jgi:hypothetical protein
MQVYCIDNQFNSYENVRLTVGKWYEVIHKQNFELIVRNDAGRRASYSRNRFATKDQLRDLRLKQILD